MYFIFSGIDSPIDVAGEPCLVDQPINTTIDEAGKPTMVDKPIKTVDVICDDKVNNETAFTDNQKSDEGLLKGTVNNIITTFAKGSM